MKNTEIRSLTTEELTQKIITEEEVTRNIQFAHAISPIENPMKIRAARKLVARLKTELKARKLANK